MILCFFPFKLDNYTVIPHQKLFTSAACHCSLTRKSMEVVGPTWSSLTTWPPDHLLVKKTHPKWDPKTIKQTPCWKKLRESSFLPSHLSYFLSFFWEWCDVVLHRSFWIRCGGVQVLPRLEIFGGPSPKSMGKSTDPCGQKSEGHEEIKAKYFVHIHPWSLT